MAKCLKCFGQGYSSWFAECTCGNHCTKIFARGYVDFELKDNAFEILNYRLKKLAREKDKYYHFSLKPNQLRIYDYDASKDFTNYVEFIKNNGVLKDVNILMYQEQYEEHYLVNVTKCNYNENEYVFCGYKRMDNIEIEPIRYRYSAEKTSSACCEDESTLSF